MSAGTRIIFVAYKNKITQKNALDRICSQYIRSHGRCEHCSSKEVLQNSHIIGRKYIKTRFDPRNCQCLCAKCHAIFEGNPLAFSEFVFASSCGQYTETMQIQAYDVSHKPDYDFWETTLKQAIKDMKPLEQLRQDLGRSIIL